MGSAAARMSVTASRDGAPPTPTPSSSPPRSDRLCAVAKVAAAGAVYLVLACLLYRPTAPLSTNHLPGCACGDPEAETWFLGWTSYALTHGHNPFLTSFLNAPMGANLAINTFMPLLAVLGMPVTLLAGPVATFNLLIRVGLAASGASMFGVLRRYVSWWPAAFGGGLLFAFSPYMTNQAVRHLFTIFVPLVPLFIPLLDDWLVSRRRTPFRAGLLIGVVAALQYLISAEILLTSAIMAAVGLVYLALKYRVSLADRAGVFARGLAAAVPAFLLIAGYGVWMLFAGPNRPQGPIHTLSDLTRYHGNLLSPLLPSGHQIFAPRLLTSIGNHIMPGGHTVEAGFYLGFPLLVLLGYLVIRCRRVPIVTTAAVVGVTAFVLTLGPRLTVAHKVLPVPLPFVIFMHLPILQDIEAARLSLFMQLAAAIILAVGLDRVRVHGWLPAASPLASGRRESSAVGDISRPGYVPGPGNVSSFSSDGVSAPGDAIGRSKSTGPCSPRWVRPVVVAGVGLAALLPLVPSRPIHSVPIHTPGLFTSEQAGLLSPGALALTLPYDVAPQNGPMVWQAASGMRFRILGGEVFVPRPDGRSTWQRLPPGPPVLRAILRADQYRYRTTSPPTGPNAVNALRLLCARSHVTMVLVDLAAPHGSVFATLVQRALRVPPRVNGRMDVWLNVPRDVSRKP